MWVFLEEDQLPRIYNLDVPCVSADHRGLASFDQRVCKCWLSRSAFSSLHPNVIFASRIPKHASTCDLKHTLSFPFSSTSIPEHCCVSAQSETAGGSMHLLGLGRQKKKHMSHN